MISAKSSSQLACGESTTPRREAPSSFKKPRNARTLAAIARRTDAAFIDLGAVQSVGYCFQIELTWRAARHNFRIAELPIVFPDRQVGQSKMSMAIFREAALGVWRLRQQS